MKLTKQTVYLTVNIEGASGNHIPDKSVLVIKEQGEMDKYWDAYYGSSTYNKKNWQMSQILLWKQQKNKGLKRLPKKKERKC